MFFFFLGDHVAAALKFELEMVACGFALPLLTLYRHVPALIHQASYSLILHKLCETLFLGGIFGADTVCLNIHCIQATSLYAITS